MPTPSATRPNSITEVISTRTCPPELDRLSDGRGTPDSLVSQGETVDDALTSIGALAPSALRRSDDGSALSTSDPLRVESKTSGAPDDDTASRERSISPWDRNAGDQSSVTPSNSSLLRYEFSNVRLLPNYSSSFLRSGSKFVGKQMSDKQEYNVDVEIIHVDMAESYLCGYLRIQGLTEDHPTLTTFFEGEIIGTKHTFQTRNEQWGANEKIDIHHWSRFPAWKPLAKQAKRTDFTYRNFAQREHVFMRWKEYFLVPDHRVRTISGASFEGFYYICFNQIEGSVSGVYFHAKSERFQQLELKHVEDHGCAPAVEFR
ncbi:Glucose-induced degradation protein 4 [Penicillium diatomitis]|uniref:Glucose-induced degradation protein 4 n=1 Tax=Penicillium diatomitis TaxID=2819901 RepID=A0A9W9XFH3_9EURO|nr:Glucose-induced degradation protein 4 [Penicillium diatomitis]KAJ5491161.1 Glucose-induced degradation protein 4 [Penicillium diatomitis]